LYACVTPCLRKTLGREEKKKKEERE